ncbi:threonine synthase [Thalassotalea atypica]|uniref:threonine synthase n=1 Tax=Thalassotalea atypica TaxID=2054316 RepID=UPI00257255E4|nr:threonine synthase [Thalassotalea atypica]
MQFYNLKENDEVVSFAQAVKQGLGKNQGLFFPEKMPAFDDIESLLALPFVERSVKVLAPFVQGSLSEKELSSIVTNAFNFPAQIQPISEHRAILELFHGPTLAFKDFGARFMAQCLQTFSKDKKITILTATSGDTGAAVAHAFHGLANIRVVILYPKGKISLLQEKMFTTLGDNIETIAIDGTFDDCQALVKDAFNDKELAQTIGLNSANSINISRLLAQVCYYFEAVAQLTRQKSKQNLGDLVVSVPSGNFGNLTAGLLGKALGLPIKRFIAATNANDTVPRYLSTGDWEPHETIATISNAMDVSNPNNWPRVEHMIKSGLVEGCVSAQSVDEEETQITMIQLAKLGYISEPHAAVAYKALQDCEDNEFGVFLGTAHPAKFKEVVENTLGQPIGLPKELADCAGEPILSIDMAADFAQLRDYLMSAK